MNRRKVLFISFLTATFILLSVTPADAFIFRRWRNRRRRANVSVNVQISGNVQQIAQHKANIQARRGRCFHPGGSFGGARYEGVGGGSTPEAARRNCCYSGYRGSKGPRKTVVASAVAQSSNGRWFACQLYR
jgi:hypothetical protein